MAPSLSVSRGELVEALKMMAAFSRGKQGAETALAFASGQLTLKTGVIRKTAPADGTWDGEARVSSRWLFSLRTTLGDMEQVPFRIDGDRLHIGGYSAPCQWDGDDLSG